MIPGSLCLIICSVTKFLHLVSFFSNGVQGECVLYSPGHSKSCKMWVTLDVSVQFFEFSPTFVAVTVPVFLANFLKLVFAYYPVCDQQSSSDSSSLPAWLEWQPVHHLIFFLFHSCVLCLKKMATPFSAEVIFSWTSLKTVALHNLSAIVLHSLALYSTYCCNFHNSCSRASGFLFLILFSAFFILFFDPYFWLLFSYTTVSRL